MRSRSAGLGLQFFVTIFAARPLGLVAALVLAASGPAPPAAAQLAPIVSGAMTYGVNISMPATTEVIPASANQVTYVTYAHIEASGTGNFHFAHGNCAGSPTAFGGDITWTHAYPLYTHRHQC